VFRLRPVGAAFLPRLPQLNLSTVTRKAKADRGRNAAPGVSRLQMIRYLISSRVALIAFSIPMAASEMFPASM